MFVVLPSCITSDKCPLHWIFTLTHPPMWLTQIRIQTFITSTLLVFHSEPYFPSTPTPKVNTSGVSWQFARLFTQLVHEMHLFVISVLTCGLFILTFHCVIYSKILIHSIVAGHVRGFQFRAIIRTAVYIYAQWEHSRTVLAHSTCVISSCSKHCLFSQSCTSLLSTINVGFFSSHPWQGWYCLLVVAHVLNRRHSISIKNVTYEKVIKFCKIFLIGVVNQYF